MSTDITSSNDAWTDPFDLAGRRAVVTGASRGIGQAIVVELVRRGAHVVGAARTEAGLKETADLVEGFAGTFVPYAVDLRSPESIESCVTSAVETLGGLDILVNNAGYDFMGRLESIDLSEFQQVIEVNLQTIFVMLKAAGPHLKDGGGSVVNISSVLGVIAARDDAAYIAAKHGVIGLTKAVALEWARKGVRVNAVAPGYVETAMLPDLSVDVDTAKYISRTVPLGRVGQPEEIANAVVFLASDASSYISGETIVIDGAISVS
ncbi:SDR family NAD(P)-dependent oxidoreductase [Streptomyces sp. NPDC015346]|uniref:SDR family NAD(P)-dependent oxidoreductase n=1 Tax=Streptomyces sp. NPDC015346 TaxID=3364954 RepID=UPI0036F64613